ncbi:carotenoid oxygenase family protein [Oscillatoriales cyanobacterium LEGE 11467]|uniref:Carotenoid oxygenase family protein n=1 Tax=Zarconia navalis LEGE 11467 TaxID=1828826 RepID=A0A928VZR1_9CYAN|nr:carotenoid oxygenase family protein [Zarconia navalis]MBE9041203.1 carotenoid oxygenase family protein [Zarconia navalis LEGE 11467]
MSDITSNATNVTADRTGGATPPRSPKALLSTSREEFYGQDSQHQPLQLTVKEGLSQNPCQLPEDLQGHVFIVGAVGYVGSPKCEDAPNIVRPSKDGWTSLLNGEGAIYRLDFHQTPATPVQEELKVEAGKAWMAMRIVKTPDYYADTALTTDPKYQKFSSYSEFEFRSFGITRLSIGLGVRNYLNTAFLPMKFSDGSERLLVTWDAGRPYEIDPRTLGLVGPIGWANQWHSMIPNPIRWPFPPILSTAHPVFDTHTDEMFTVNASKSILNLLWLSRLIPSDIDKWLDRIHVTFIRRLLKRIANGSVGLFLELVEKFLASSIVGQGDRLYLNRWHGSGTTVEQWEVRDANDRPIRIRQSLHQMGLTKDYIVISDSAFKLLLEDLIPVLNPNDPLILEDVEKFLERIYRDLSYPQLPYTDIYIVARAQLNPDEKTVTAKRVRLKPETAHFLVEYDNPEGKITLFAAHTAASDPSEFLRQKDISAAGDLSTTEALQERSGMFVSPMDLNRLGCWTIDAEKECSSARSSFLSKTESKQYLWSIALYAWRGFQPDRFTDIYWNCWGAWSDLLSEFVFEMYEDYPHRWLGASEMKKSVESGKPANLLRMHVDRTSASPSKLTIEDAYDFPPGYFGNSPQFVPRSGTDDPCDGYIVCVVLFSDNFVADKSELWIFDGKSLSSGPKYRLSHPQLNIGMTVHSTWLSKLESPPVREDYDIRKDYPPTLMTALFEDEIYPHFDRPQS